MEPARTVPAGTSLARWTPRAWTSWGSSNLRRRNATTIFYGGCTRTPQDLGASRINETHYEDVLVARVHDLVPKHVWKRRYEFINNWEKLLVDEKNTTILKFFLYISKDEQLARFKERLDDPARQWKISDSDYSERKLWSKYIDAFEAAISKCSTEHAPWFIIPSNHKWFRNFAVSQIVARAMEDMKLAPCQSRRLIPENPQTLSRGRRRQSEKKK